MMIPVSERLGLVGAMMKLHSTEGCNGGRCYEIATTAHCCARQSDFHIEPSFVVRDARTAYSRTGPMKNTRNPRLAETGEVRRREVALPVPHLGTSWAIAAEESNPVKLHDEGARSHLVSALHDLN